MPDKAKHVFNKREYDNQYIRENYRKYQIRFSYKNDEDVISKLDSVPNKIDYIRQLVLADIKKSQQN